MSKFIKHIDGLERRIGKRVKVNSTDYYNVTRGDNGAIKVGPYQFPSQRVLDAFLVDHTIAAAGYTRDCGCSKGFIEDVEDVPLNTQVEVMLKDYKELGWIPGEFSYSQECYAKASYLYFLSDCANLSGSEAVDKKGYRHSWAMASEDKKKLLYPVKIRNIFSDGKEGLWSLEDNSDVRHEVYGKLKYHKEERSWILLTDDEEFDGHQTSEKFKDGYKYSWWVYDGKECRSGNYGLKYISKDKPVEPEVPHEYIMDTPCMVGTKAHGLVEGMLVFQDKEYYILTNNSEYNGAPAPDKKGYRYSWVVGDKEDAKSLALRTNPLEESCNDNQPDPSGNQLVRIAEALERIAKALEK